MSNAVVFLVVPALAALVGSVLIWLVSRSRRPVDRGFHEQLRVLAPNDSSRPAAQPSGIVPLDDHPFEEH